MPYSEPLSRNEKRLIVLHELSEAGAKKVKFEDLAVGLWKKFPNDFHLKGYPEYPDSDLHRPLYSFRMQGLLEVKEKVFSFTAKGVTEAERAIRKAEGKNPEEKSEKLSRDVEKEIRRLQFSDAFTLFLQENKEQILDTDFYTYLGTTVRSTKNDFLGRLNTVQDAINDAMKPHVDKKTQIIAKKLQEMHEFLLHKFKADIDFKRTNA